MPNRENVLIKNCARIAQYNRATIKPFNEFLCYFSRKAWHGHVEIITIARIKRRIGLIAVNPYCFLGFSHAIFGISNEQSESGNYMACGGKSSINEIEPHQCVIGASGIWFNMKIGSHLPALGIARNRNLGINSAELRGVESSLLSQLGIYTSNLLIAKIELIVAGNNCKNGGEYSANSDYDSSDSNDPVGAKSVSKSLPAILLVIGVYLLIFVMWFFWGADGHKPEDKSENSPAKIRTISTSPPNPQYPKDASQSPLPLRECNGGSDES